MRVTPGTTDVTTHFNLEHEDGTPATGVTITGLDLQYVRSGASPAAKVDATALAAADSAHSDNQAIEIDATDQPGLYRVDWPDAAFAAGVREVVLSVVGAGLRPAHLRVELQTIQTGDAYAVVNSGTHGNAALKALLDALGDDVDAALLDLAAILQDTGTTLDDLVDDLEARLTAALAAKLAAHAAAVLTLVVHAGSSGTTVVFKTVNGTTPSAVNDFYNGRVIIFTSGALAGQATSISDYVGATATATVPAMTGTPAEDVTAVIV